MEFGPPNSLIEFISLRSLSAQSPLFILMKFSLNLKLIMRFSITDFSVVGLWVKLVRRLLGD